MTQVTETIQIIRDDVAAVEAKHVHGWPNICAECREEWPCRPVACAIWLRRIVLERAL